MTAARSDLLTVSLSPHCHAGTSVQRRMLLTCATLAPAVGVTMVLGGVGVILTILTGVAAAAATDAIFRTCRSGLPALADASAVLAGLLLSCTLPPSAPFWMAAIGAAFGVFVMNIPAAGPGRNFLNPALAGRAFLLLAFPLAIKATAAVGETAVTGQMLLSRFLCFQDGGWIGGVSPAALLIGAVVALRLRLIDYWIPAAFFATAFMLYWATGDGAAFGAAGPLTALYRLMGGGLPLAAMFLATDFATAPASIPGRLLFGAGCGAGTLLFKDAGYGATYSILLMNCLTPYLDRYVTRRPSLRPSGKTPDVGIAASAHSETAAGEEVGV